MSIVLKGIKLAMAIAMIMVPVSVLGALGIIDGNLALIMLWILFIPLGVLVISPIVIIIYYKLRDLWHSDNGDGK